MVSSSTKEMGPVTKFGIVTALTFCQKAEEAILKHAEHTHAFEEFNAALPANLTDEWLKMVTTWETAVLERDSSKPNPFAATVQILEISENAVQLELAEEEAVQLQDNLTAVPHNDVSPSRLIVQGLELEDHQHILHNDTKALAEHEGGDDPPSTTNIDLLLPSSLIQKSQCDVKFLDYEWQLCYAQANGALHEIHHAIITCLQMYKSKDILVCGQCMHTQSLALIAKVSAHIDSAHEKYNIVHDALIVLGHHFAKVGWESELQPLMDMDLHGITAEEDDTSKGRQIMSWI
ncbi:hypothetical protein C0995_011529 [Termitomyces sp. Mi166|nr:hypothetical protein C0995_011529 [Termitomyces sp. Mi166\